MTNAEDRREEAREDAREARAEAKQADKDAKEEAKADEDAAKTAAQVEADSPRATLAAEERNDALRAGVMNRQRALREADEFWAAHPTRKELEAQFAAADKKAADREKAAK